MRKARRGEYVCRCRAYDFPHRFSGGACDGLRIVEDQWWDNYGGGACQACGLNNRTESEPYCEVVMGQEKPRQCPVWQEFVERHEIIIYHKKGRT